jgi:hypothetical protein
MKNKILLIGAVVFLAMVASAWAADVTGKWVAQIPGRDGMSENTFNFKVEGTKLSGTLSTQQGETAITDGTVSGDEISFVIVRKMGENEMKQLWKGKVAGDEIKFTREVQGGRMGGPGGGGPPGGGAPGGGGAGGGRGGGAGGQEIVAKRVK